MGMIMDRVLELVPLWQDRPGNVAGPLLLSGTTLRLLAQELAEVRMPAFTEAQLEEFENGDVVAHFHNVPVIIDDSVPTGQVLVQE